jgi:imidazolonepropionase-like amidohydrolase
MKAVDPWIPFMVLALIAASPTRAADVTLHCGSRVDVRAERLVGPTSIVVAGSRIASVEPGYVTPEGDGAVVDLRAHTCMPGMMDAHVHLSMEYGPDSYSERFRLNPADRAFRMVGYARRTLLAGFTTVRDLGSRDNLNVALERAVNQGLIAGPRIYSAARSLATTGGHADPTNGVRADLMGDPGPEAGVINGVDDARKARRRFARSSRRPGTTTSTWPPTRTAPRA